MKTTLQLNKLLVFLLFVSVSVSAMGQYSGGFSNVAKFKTATASASAAGLGPELAVDSSLTTFCSVTGDAPAWIMVDLGALHNIKGFGMILPDASELPTSLTMQASQDGISWVDVRDLTITAEGTYSYDISVLEPMQYFRYYITAKNSRASFTELMLYGYQWLAPSSPLALEATGIESNQFTANWTDKNRSEGYILTVAFDVDFNNKVPGYINLDMGDVTSRAITGLASGTAYFYRLRAYNLAGISQWSNTMETATRKVAQTITFEAIGEKSYGDADFDLVASASSGLPVSFVSSADSIASISGTTLSIVGAGTVSITAVQNGDAMYDTAAPVIQDLVVQPAELTVTGTIAESKVYDGTADAVLSGAVLEGVLGTDDVSLADADMGSFAQSDVGTAIEVTGSMVLGGTDAANYSLVPPSGLTADITEKELVITAADYLREACEVNPELNSYTYSGFVDGEDETVLTETPLSSCVADESSAPGDYEVTVSGGAAPNYLISYVHGTLTVNPDITAPTLTVQAISIKLDEGGSASISPADLVVSADDNCAVTDTTLSQDTFTTDDLGNVDVEVVVMDAAGNSKSAMATVTVSGYTGINELSEIEANLFPNPTSGNVELVLDSQVDVLKVMDMTGKTVIKRSHLGSRESLDLSGFSNGIYIFQLQSGEQMKHIKVIKK